MTKRTEYTARQFREDNVIVDYATQAEIDVSRPAYGRGRKIVFLIDFGIKELRVKGGEVKPTETCPDEVVNAVVASRYLGAMKRLSDVKRGLRKIVGVIPAPIKVNPFAKFRDYYDAESARDRGEL